MRQKLGIIQVIMENQNIILFDEPTRGLDNTSSNKFIELVKKLNSIRKTIIIFAHDGVDRKIPFNRKFTIDRNNYMNVLIRKHKYLLAYSLLFPYLLFIIKLQ